MFFFFDVSTTIGRRFWPRLGCSSYWNIMRKSGTEHKSCECYVWVQVLHFRQSENSRQSYNERSIMGNYLTMLCRCFQLYLPKNWCSCHLSLTKSGTGQIGEECHPWVQVEISLVTIKQIKTDNSKFFDSMLLPKVIVPLNRPAIYIRDSVEKTLKKTRWAMVSFYYLLQALLALLGVSGLRNVWPWVAVERAGELPP